ncbi:hypothetical protein RIR_jg40124.t1 [Rhizophagus irregularis DAOM 181602=DAOM 197198]|uniref:Uncharacterized protein n=2 Tax=Rhizophagus irregularis TaxID=588596 RepID=A0A015KAC5_RHIIW|nr:hypothetical protein RirG_216300 [Rhizophagus irregularis DAOM 197198w]GBC14802.1 hypothetical protein RIR_jg40124.t1 [Rhizophagus irregularis DAOM 181602=DAOM 197198]
MVFVGINISGMGLDGSTVYKIGIEDGELIGAVDSSIETTESDWYRMIVHKVWDQKLVVVRIRLSAIVRVYPSCGFVLLLHERSNRFSCLFLVRGLALGVNWKLESLFQYICLLPNLKIEPESRA